MPLQPFPIVRAEHMTNQLHVNIVIVPPFVQTLARPAHMRKERLRNGTEIIMMVVLIWYICVTWKK